MRKLKFWISFTLFVKLTSRDFYESDKKFWILFGWILYLPVSFSQPIVSQPLLSKVFPHQVFNFSNRLFPSLLIVIKIVFSSVSATYKGKWSTAQIAIPKIAIGRIRLTSFWTVFISEYRTMSARIATGRITIG